jgi:putative ABC transport system ATP-binding protein
MPALADQPIIIAKGLTRIYQLGAIEVIGVRDIDLEVGEGEFVVLRGNSGSGKSTLLSLFAGLDRPTRGSLRVGNQDLHHATPSQLTRYRRDVVGMVFQSFNLLPTLTVLENVCLPSLLAGHSYAHVQPKAIQLLDWLQLQSRIDHLPGQLSGGEMQRTAIARALINDPAIILADEPTGNLDSCNGQIVVELLSELRTQWGRTVIVATHSHIADGYATVQFRLKDGVIAELGPDLNY